MEPQNDVVFPLCTWQQQYTFDNIKSYVKEKIDVLKADHEREVFRSYDPKLHLENTHHPEKITN